MKSTIIIEGEMDMERKNPQIIVALDKMSPEQAIAMAQKLSGQGCLFKVHATFDDPEGGTKLCDTLAPHGRIMLDMKVHEIPRASEYRITNLLKHPGVEIVTCHLSAGRKALTQMASIDRGNTLLAGITVLTSLSLDDLHEMNIQVDSVAEQVITLARMGAECGIPAVVCSGQEVRMLREDEKTSGLKLITPGITPLFKDKEFDQARSVSPAAATYFGSDYLVIGSGIAGQPDPLEALRKVRAEMEVFTHPRYDEEELIAMLAQHDVVQRQLHLVLKSGRHGSAYVDKDIIGLTPELLDTIAYQLALQYVEKEIEVVIGPAYGAISLAAMVCRWLRIMKKSMGIPEDQLPINVYSEKTIMNRLTEETGPTIRPKFHSYISKKTCLLIEDITITGGTVEKLANYVFDLGGLVTQAGVIWNRGGYTSNRFGVAATINAQFPTWEATDCPLCKAEVPICTELGHGKAFLDDNRDAREWNHDFPDDLK